MSRRAGRHCDHELEALRPPPQVKAVAMPRTDQGNVDLRQAVFWGLLFVQFGAGCTSRLDGRWLGVGATDTGAEWYWMRFEHKWAGEAIGGAADIDGDRRDYDSGGNDTHSFRIEGARHDDIVELHLASTDGSSPDRHITVDQRLWTCGYDDLWPVCPAKRSLVGQVETETGVFDFSAINVADCLEVSPTESLCWP